MIKAVWNNTILAEAEKAVHVEGNAYFPAESVHFEYLKKTETHTECPWKGLASYYDVVVGSKVNHDAAWVYEEPKPKANRIKGHIAFWKGVEVIRE